MIRIVGSRFGLTWLNNGMRVREGVDAAINRKYPPEVSSDWVIDFVADMSDREDPCEGPVPEHILEFGMYRLERLLLSQTDVRQHGYDHDLAADYAAMPTVTAPPIVFDPVDRQIIDGFHRVNAAIIRGEDWVLAYVGVPRRDPHSIRATP